jgi:serine/threonine-protein kinase PRP4
MMEVNGKLNHRMIKKASLGEMHFDEQLNFISIEQDKITRQASLPHHYRVSADD